MVPTEFLTGYVAALNRPLLPKGNLSRSATRRAVEDCHDFFLANREQLEEAVGNHGYSWLDAGTDFYLSRNDEGGYSERESLALEVAAELHGAALSFGGFENEESHDVGG